MYKIRFFGFLIFSFLSIHPFFCFAQTIQDAPDAPKNATSAYIFAHQDDELLIISKMKKEVDAGISVYCIWITKGEKSAPADIREKESREAMKRVGVPEEHLYFLGYSDQESCKSLLEIVEKVMVIIKKIEPTRIYTDAYEGGNIDHDVANFVSYESTRRSGLKIDLYEFPCYNNYYGRFKVNEFVSKDDVETLYTKLDEEDLDFKEEIFEVYESQKLSITAMRAFLFDVRKMLKFGEPYRAVPEHKYLEPPHSGKLMYEITVDKKASHSFNDFKKSVEEYYSGLLDSSP